MNAVKYILLMGAIAVVIIAAEQLMDTTIANVLATATAKIVSP
jgi:hypothetical protein